MPKASKTPSPRAQAGQAIMKIAEGLYELAQAFEEMDQRGQLPREFRDMAEAIQSPLSGASATFRRMLHPPGSSKVTMD